MVDITDWSLAEDIYFFVSSPEVWEDFCRCQEKEGPLSMAEYVDRFKMNEFEVWLNSRRKA